MLRGCGRVRLCCNLDMNAVAVPRMGKLNVFLIMLVVSIGSIVWQLPAQWIAPLLGYSTQGAVKLVDAQGTLWRGAGSVVVVRSETEQWMLPQRVAWMLSPQMFSAAFALQVSIGTGNEVNAMIGWGEKRLEAGELGMPAKDVASIVALGSPINSLLPKADITVKWPRLNLDKPEGTIRLNVQNLRTRFDSAAVLGSYDVGIRLGQDIALKIATPDAKARVQATGAMTIVAGKVQSLETVLSPKDAADHAQLAGLFNVLGRRVGEQYIFKLN